jgi:hypothetical protein
MNLPSMGKARAISGATVGVQNADIHRHWADSERLQLVSDPCTVEDLQGIGYGGS